MKKSTKKFGILLLTVVFFVLFLSGCVSSDTYRGIISDVKCDKAIFCKVDIDNLDQRYIEVAFTITINNDNYTQKNLVVVAQDEKGVTLHSETCVFGEDKQVTIQFEEHSDLFNLFEGIANTSLQTKKIVIYDGSTVVGSVKINEIKVYALV